MRQPRLRAPLLAAAALAIGPLACQPSGPAAPATSAPGQPIAAPSAAAPTAGAPAATPSTAAGRPSNAPSSSAHAKVEIPPSAFHQAALASPPPEVTAEALVELQRRGAVLIDLRSPAEFAAQHLEGAVNLPATDLTDERLAALVPDHATTIVVYCDFNLMPTRRIALTTLGAPTIQQLGYRDVRVLEPLWGRGAHPLVLVPAP